MRRAALGALLIAVALPAQRPARPELTLELQAKDPLDGVPQRVRLTLRNMTDHDLRLPEPGIACDSPYGSLWVRAIPSTRVGRDPLCPPQPANEDPRSWLTLGPGGYLDRWYSIRQFHLGDASHGRFDLQGEYRPPALNAARTRSLLGEGIVPPRSTVRSNRMVLPR